ncbi:MAG: NlpC/P60 family protein [Bacteroidota bacterium]
MEKLQLRFLITIISLLSLVIFTACSTPTKKEVATSETTVSETEDAPIEESEMMDPPEGVDDEDSSYHGGEIIVTNPAHDSVPEKVVVLNPGEYQAGVFADSLTMEKTYSPMLSPITSLKTSDPKTYWFIVSWLNTAYKTPSWTGYNDYEKWKAERLKAGIDCSGFCRVMADRVFDKKIRGSSRGIYKSQVEKVERNQLQKGDLVFFTFPGSEDRKIVHVGMYLLDDLFVHATSTNSAKKGRGLSINSLNEERWSGSYVGGGHILESN